MLIYGHINKFNVTSLSTAVGKGCKNSPLDVLVIQRLLLGSTASYVGKESLVPDGFYGPKTEKQIELFQKHVLKYKSPDRKIDVDGKTHRKLRDLVGDDFVAKHKLAATMNQKKMVSVPLFISLFKKQFPKEPQLSGLERLLKNCLLDPSITDVRWIAYMLATVRRECGSSWKPIEEWGKGKNKAYSKVVSVTDPITKKISKNVYYGRGFVQLTWDKNYKTVGQAIGMGNQLYLHPEKALDHTVAYKIMSLGMRKGLFTNASLSQFISGSTANYVGARYIINGQDHALEIANNAVVYEALLKASQPKNSIQEELFLFNRAIV